MSRSKGSDEPDKGIMVNRGAGASTNGFENVALGARALSSQDDEGHRSSRMPIADTFSSDGALESATYQVAESIRLGPYQVVCELASGGMASVYLALYRSVEGFEKLCAVKRIHPHLANDRDFTDMFADEARIAACISHPFVCSVFSFGRSQQSHYIAMEFLRGEPLSSIARRVARSPELGDDPRFPALAARLIAHFAEGLFAAHSMRDDRGTPLEIVHRDVTPHNLFVLYDGTVRVTDFGIAQARRRLHHTEGQKLKGKLSYVAPEQLGEGPVDQRVDIWGLGVTLWELLTGRRLFLGSSEGETLSAVLSRVVRPPSVYRATVPPELDRIVLRALARDVNQRYRSARDLARDLERFLASIGDQVPAMDVADWMTSVFPQGAERLQTLAELAARVSAATADDTVVRVPSAPPPRRDSVASYDFKAAPKIEGPDEAHSALTAEYPRGVSASEIDATLGAVLEKVRRMNAPSSPLLEPREEPPPLPLNSATRLPLNVTTRAREPPLLERYGRSLAVIASALLLAGGVASLALRDRPPPVAHAPVPPVPPPAAPAAAAERVEPQATVAAPEVVVADVEIDGLAKEPTARKKPGAARAAVAPKTTAPSDETAPPRPLSQVGDVFVTGGAGDVLERGQLLGRAPGRFRLSVGQHALTLRSSSGAEQTMQVDIRAGAPTLVTLSASN